MLAPIGALVEALPTADFVLVLIGGYTFRATFPEAPVRLPRLTTRRLMVVVAAAAIALYGLHLIRLRRDYQAIAAAHVQRGQLFVLTPVMHESRGLTFSLSGIDSQRRQEYHAQLRRKFERAARYPWLPVPTGHRRGRSEPR